MPCRGQVQCLQPNGGPLILAFSEIPGAAARIFASFSRQGQRDKLVVPRPGGRWTRPFQPAVDCLASLPTRDEAIIACSWPACGRRSNIASHSRGLSTEIPGKLVRTIEAVRRQKEARLTVLQNNLIDGSQNFSILSRRKSAMAVSKQEMLDLSPA